jgi:hypothetical protein
MRPDDIKKNLSRKPFVSFRLHLSTGVFFDVHNPESAQVERSTIHIGLPLEGDKQRFVVIALVHIVWIEVLLPAP